MSGTLYGRVMVQCTLKMLSGCRPGDIRNLRTELESAILRIIARVLLALEFPRLTYTEKAIKEALRLYPPVWAFVRDGRRAVSVSFGGTPKVWDLESGVEVRTLDDRSGVWGVAVSGDERRALFASDDGTPRA